jgi:hypothetical protein
MLWFLPSALELRSRCRGNRKGGRTCRLAEGGSCSQAAALPGTPAMRRQGGRRCSGPARCRAQLRSRRCRTRWRGRCRSLQVGEGVRGQPGCVQARTAGCGAGRLVQVKGQVTVNVQVKVR